MSSKQISSPSKHRSIKQFLGNLKQVNQIAAEEDKGKQQQHLMVDISPIKDQGELSTKQREIGFNEKSKALYKAWSRREVVSEGIELYVDTPGFDDSSCRYLTEHNPCLVGSV